jgi:hypothetical protein
MPQKRVKTRDVVSANYKTWFAVWEVGTPYIDVFGNSSSMQQVIAAAQKGERTPDDSTAIHALSTNGDDHKWLESPKAYVKNELMAWADEDGDDYTAAGYR